MNEVAGPDVAGPDVVAGSAAAEWAALVTTAVLGTDRRPLPPAEAGWDAWAAHDDAAVALLDRAAAVVTALRAGMTPAPTLAMPPAAPDDPRPPCPLPAALRLERILRGEHEILLAEWLERCRARGFQLPWAALPVLLLRGRRAPELDVVVREVASERAAWLAEAVPELGVRPHAARPKVPVEPLRLPARLADSAAMVATVVGAFAERAVSWAAAAQLRQVVLALDPDELPRLAAGLSALAFEPTGERTRRELISLAEFRSAMLADFEVRDV